MTNNIDSNELISSELLDEMGVSQVAYDEIASIVGKLPSIDELSTLIAMWEASGKKQGLLSWLKGQPHSIERHDFIVNEHEPQGKEIREPRVGDCIAIAREMLTHDIDASSASISERFTDHGDEIYMIGDVSELFVNSVYGQKYLHLVDNPATTGTDDETKEYIEMIAGALADGGIIKSMCGVGKGGLFGTLARCGWHGGIGFDIMSYREVRLDAFLFGEEGVRYAVTLDEKQEDYLLQKLTEARLNCCLLGRTTKGRIIIDGMDFGLLKP